MILISKTLKLFLFVGFFIQFTACEKMFMDEIKNTPQKNFEVLWNTVDTKYSFLIDKKIDWNAVKEKYKSLIHNNISPLKEFEIYKEMLFKLKDGHVNLFSGFDVSRNWKWYLDYNYNYNQNIVEQNYLGKNYLISGGLKHTILKDNFTEKKYGYIRYENFSYSVSYIDFVVSLFENYQACGIIIDVRQNAGGKLSYAKKFANRFADKKRVGFIEYYKIGKRHNDFSKGYKNYCERDKKYSPYNKPVVILTNRKCYSATSFFVTMMKEFPNVIVIGDKTGGGSGLPVDFTLPNGWKFRFSTTKSTDPRGYNFEFGVEPDKYISLLKTDENKGIDTLIEEAKKIIDKQ